MMAQVSEYLEEHIDEKVTVSDLASLFNLSVSQVRYNFFSEFGLTPAEYMRGCRMRKAAVLLTDTDYTMMEIASRTGYENPSKFASAFRRSTGSSPVEYRMRQKSMKADRKNTSANA